MHKVALISVSNRDNLDRLARHLVECGYTLLVTSGSGKYLEQHGIRCTQIEEYTGQREILDGRVKTLHPKIHGGLLAKRDNPDHQKQMNEEGISGIDIAVVNLYPFVENLKSEAAQSPKKMIELIDIGGPTMIRAAAKNFAHVVPLIDPIDYDRIIPFITKEDTKPQIPLALRRELSAKVFTWLANYNLEIAKYISAVTVSPEGDMHYATDLPFDMGSVAGSVLTRKQALRYGENPHQRGAFYQPLNVSGNSVWKQLQGKELSYNNLLDFDAAVRLMRSLPLESAAVAILKHLNPCGVATGVSLVEALAKAKKCDPRSHFGGILVFNRAVDKHTAEGVAEDFAEIVVAPRFEKEALVVFEKKKNLRVIEVDLSVAATLEYRSVVDGMLIQEADSAISSVVEAEVMTTRKPTVEEMVEVDLAWRVCAHVKSNAVVVVQGGILVGVGAGQMSRIDSTEIAISKALKHGHSLQGGVAASDAFFPFPDSVELLAAQGVKVIIAPRGSRADEEVVATANRLGISLLFVQDRHFRH